MPYAGASLGPEWKLWLVNVSVAFLTARTVHPWLRQSMKATKAVRFWFLARPLGNL